MLNTYVKRTIDSLCDGKHFGSPTIQECLIDELMLNGESILSSFWVDDLYALLLPKMTLKPMGSSYAVFPYSFLNSDWKIFSRNSIQARIVTNKNLLEDKQIEYLDSIINKCNDQ